MVLSCDMYVLLLVFHYYIVILYERNYILIYRGGGERNQAELLKILNLLVGPPLKKSAPLCRGGAKKS